MRKDVLRKPCVEAKASASIDDHSGYSRVTESGLLSVK
jgi:hypothetical protein